MARELLWKALAEATDAAQAATHEHAQEATPQARAAAEAAMQEYVSRLAPVIGRVAAFTYEVSLRTHQDAVDRLDGLNATIDAGEAVDMKLWLFFEEVAAARGAQEAAEAAVAAAVDKARAHERVSCLPDPLERRLLTAFRSRTGCPS